MLGRFLQLLKAVRKIKPRISIIWGITIILFGFTIDLLQWGMEAILVGIVINPILDDVGMPILLYIFFRLKGVKLSSPTRLIPLLITMIIETLSDGIIPLWGIDISISVLTSWAEDVFVQAQTEALDIVPGLKTISRPAAKLTDKALVSDEAIQQGQKMKQGPNGERNPNARGPQASLSQVGKELGAARLGSSNLRETTGKLYNPTQQVGKEIAAGAQKLETPKNPGNPKS